MSTGEPFYPSIIFDINDATPAETLQAFDEIGEKPDLGDLQLLMAAAELAIAITPTTEGTLAPRLAERIPESRPREPMKPQALFGLLSDAEKANLRRAGSIVQLIRGSMVIITRQMTESNMSEHTRGAHSG